MKSIIVGKKLPFASGVTGDYKKDIDGLEKGAITISRSDNDKIVKYTTTSSDKPFGANNDFDRDTMLQVIQGLGDGKTLLSPVINKDNLVYTKTEYKTPVAKIVHVGRDNTTTGDGEDWMLGNYTVSDHVGEYVGIRVYDLSMPPGVTNNTKLVSYRIKKGDDEGDVFDGLFKKLEKLEGEFYSDVTKNESGSDYGYKFTGILGKNFVVIPEFLLEGDNVKVETDYDIGSGLADYLLELEKDYASRRGYNATYTMREELYSAGFHIDPYVNYDVFVLEFQNPNQQILASGTDPMIQHCIVALPTGDTYPNISEQFERLLTVIEDSGTDNTWGTNITHPEHTITGGVTQVSSGDGALYIADSEGDLVAHVASEGNTDTGDVPEGRFITATAVPTSGHSITKWVINPAGSTAYDLEDADGDPITDTSIKYEGEDGEGIDEDVTITVHITD